MPNQYRRNTGKTWRRIAQSTPEKAWLKEVGAAHQIFREQALRIADASKQSTKKSLTRAYLQNPWVKLAAAAKVCGGDAEREETTRLRDEINVWQPPLEPVNWFPLPKSNGKFRPLCLMPSHLAASHKMIKQLVDAQRPHHANLYGVPDRSRDAAVKQAQEWVRKGYKFLAHLDVIDCFQSINSEALYQLPLPRRTIETQLQTSNLQFRQLWGSQGDSIDYTPNDHDVHNPSGPRGLMQGSPASSAILAWFMYEVLSKLPTTDNVKVLICFDNILVAARNSADRQEMIGTLVDVFRRLPIGPLELCPPEFPSQYGLDFLGYNIDDTTGEIRIADNPLDKFEDRLEAALENDLLSQYPLPINTLSEILAFSNGFSSVDDKEDVFFTYLEITKDIANVRQHPIAIHLTNNLFAQRGTLEREIIDGLIHQN